LAERSLERSLQLLDSGDTIVLKQSCLYLYRLQNLEMSLNTTIGLGMNSFLLADLDTSDFKSETFHKGFRGLENLQAHNQNRFSYSTGTTLAEKSVGSTYGLALATINFKELN